MHAMPLVAGLFLQKSHQLYGFFAENDLSRYPMNVRHPVAHRTHTHTHLHTRKHTPPIIHIRIDKKNIAKMSLEIC